MKIIGTLLLLLGILLAAGGLLAAVFNFGINNDPGGLCSRADQRLQEANVAVKKWEAAKGTPDETRLKQEADTALKVQRISEDGCAEVLQRSKVYGIISISVAVFGIVLFLAGIFLRRKGSQH
jgi:hypothetical protein